MTYIPKYISESSSIKHVTVDLQLEGVAIEQNIEGITHIDSRRHCFKN